MTYCTILFPQHTDSDSFAQRPSRPSMVDHLSNALATPAQLSTSSSSLDGIPSDLEASIRYAGALLTQAAGILLRLSQDIIAQAIVTFTRFWIGPEGGSLRIYAAKVCGEATENT